MRVRATRLPCATAGLSVAVRLLKLCHGGLVPPCHRANSAFRLRTAGKPMLSDYCCHKTNLAVQGCIGLARVGMLWCLSLLFLLHGCANPAKPPASAPPAPEFPLSILVDSIHAHNYLAEPRGDDQFEYHQSNAMRRGLAYLRWHKVAVEEAKIGRLTPELLRRHRLLYVNLVSADLPPFYVDEIRAIKDYLESGGSAFIIVDHSNCYLHNHKLAPLLDELGIRSYNETVCERAPHTLGTAPGWLAITRFSDHPVTRGLRVLGLQAAGAIDERYAVATSSERSWGDLWTTRPYLENVEPGFYGNWQFDSGERTGPLGVVLARDVGRGRIVIVTDQNFLGNNFLHYADNYRLFLNAFAWLLRQDQLADAAEYHRWTGPRVVLYDDPRRTTFASNAGVGFHNAMIALGRQFNVFVTDEPVDAEVIVLAHPDQDLRPETLQKLVDHLRAGRAIVFLDPRSGRQGVIESLQDRLGDSQDQPEADCVIRRFASGGRIVLCTSATGYGNMQLAGPTIKPTEEQRRAAARMVGVIKAQMK